jgi:hypothetical protein
MSLGFASSKTIPRKSTETPRKTISCARQTMRKSQVFVILVFASFTSRAEDEKSDNKQYDYRPT